MFWTYERVSEEADVFVAPDELNHAALLLDDCLGGLDVTGAAKVVQCRPATDKDGARSGVRKREDQCRLETRR